jgi:hypothetical protein
VKNILLFHQFPDGDLQNAGRLVETQRLILSRSAGSRVLAGIGADGGPEAAAFRKALNSFIIRWCFRSLIRP